jgi:hypothetical protein
MLKTFGGKKNMEKATMKNNLVICGDSFNIGIGCRDLDNEPYGQLLSKELGIPIINLAKGSSTNLSIFLQVQYAVEKLKDTTEYVIFSHTSYDRLDWFPPDCANHRDISLTDVNYHEYPPYGVNSYMTRIPHPLKDDVNYSGKMYTENVMGIIDFWETRENKEIPDTDYYHRFKYEPKYRMKMLYDYGINIMHPAIERLKGISNMVLAHTVLRSANIKHLLLTDEPGEYSKYMPKENIAQVDWGKLSNDFPDDIPTLHTSAAGHKIVADTILKKFEQNGWK